MPNTTIISKNYGRQTINVETLDASTVSMDSTIWKIVEHMFNEWYDYNTQPGAPMGKDIEGMYYGEGDQPAIYSKRGAIQQGVETLIDFLREDPKPIINTKQILAMDIECAFE